MLTNRKSRSSQSPLPAATAQKAASRGPDLLLTVVDQTFTITGDLQSSGELHVKGRIRGNIHCQAIIVAEEGSVEGGILANHVLIQGRTKGFIRATHIELGPTASVESDLFHATLIVHDGALFEGSSETNKSQKHSEIDTDIQVEELRSMADRMKAQRPTSIAPSSDMIEIAPAATGLLRSA